MAGVTEKELEKRLTEAGKKLEHPPHATDELLRILEDVENCLSMVEQSPSESMQLAVGPAMNALVKPELLRHQDKDVRLVVATCISEITRITAPEAPYDDELMMEFFGLIVESFESLHEIKSPSFGRRVTILETVAKVRSCVVMLDLECDELILKMFKCFFANASKDHPENVSTSMQTIMTLVLDESEDISQQLLSVLLTSLRKEKKEESPAEHELAVNVVRRCAEKLRPYLTSEMSAEAFTSSNLQQEYHEVVFEICQPGSHMSLPIVANSAEHPLVEGTHAPSIAEGKDLQLSDQTASLQAVGKSSAADEDLVKDEDKHITDKKELTSEDKHAPESDVNGNNTFPQKLSDSGNKDDGKENMSQDTLSPATSKASKGRRSVQSRRPTAISKTEMKKSPDTKCLDSIMPSVQVEEGEKSKKLEVLPEIAKPSNNSLGGSNAQTLPSSKRKRSRSGKETKEMGNVNSLSQSNAEKGGLASARPNDDNISVDALTDQPKEDIAGLVDSSETKEEAAFISSPEHTKKEAEVLSSVVETKITDSLVPSPRPNKNTDGLVSPSRSIKDNSGSPSRTRSSTKEPLGLPSPTKSTSKDTAGLATPSAKHILADDDDTGTDSSRAKRVRRPRTAGKRVGIKEDSKLPGLTIVAAERTSDGVAGRAVTQSAMPETSEQVEASKDLGTKSSKRLKRKVEAIDSTTPKLGEKTPSSSQKHVKEKDSPDATREDGSRPKKMQKVASVPDSVDKSLSQAGESSKRTPRTSAKKRSISGLEKTPTSEKSVEEELVGRKIKVWWPHDKQFYDGIVEFYDPKMRKHRISYNDGDVEILNLQRQRFELIDDNPMTEKSSTLVGSPKTPGDKVVKKRTNKMEDSTVKQGTESSGRGGSQPLKRRKVSRLQSVSPNDNGDLKNTSAGLSERHPSASATVSNVPKDSNKPTSARKGRQQKQGSGSKKDRQMAATNTPTNENVKIKGAKGMKAAMDQEKTGMSSDTGARSSDDEPLIAWKSRTRSE